MIAVIRVRGTANISPDHRKTLELLMLHKPNHAVFVAEEAQLTKMVEKVKDYVTYGEIDSDTGAELLRKRGRATNGERLDKKFLEKEKAKSFEDVAKKIIEGKETLRKLGIKPVFRLSPPRKGHKRGGIKKSYAVGGALGYRASDINALLRKMM